MAVAPSGPVRIGPLGSTTGRSLSLLCNGLPRPCDELELAPLCGLMFGGPGNGRSSDGVRTLGPGIGRSFDGVLTLGPGIGRSFDGVLPLLGGPGRA